MIIVRHTEFEPICRVLPIAPSTYHTHVAQRADLEKLSARPKRDMVLRPEIARVFRENFEVYGARKVWRQLQREGVNVDRCTVERQMQSRGLQGVIRGKSVRTTISDKTVPWPLDHVNRQFNAPYPNRADFKRSSQHDACPPIGADGQASLQAFSNRGSCVAASLA